MRASSLSAAGIPESATDQITAEDIERAGFPWSYIDNIDEMTPLEKGKAIIVNTDTEGGPGVHWIVAIPIDETHVFIYDPLGPDNPRVDHEGRPVMLKLKIDLQRALGGPVKFKLYPYGSQMPNSTYCGWFSLYVADLLQRYIAKHPDASANDLNGEIERKFGTSPDAGDQRKVIQRFRI